MPNIESTVEITASHQQRAYGRLIGGLAFFELTHVLGLIGMLTLLLPGMDPSLTAAARADYVNTHAWAWRLGWLPWQLSAASDVWVTAALLAWTNSLQARRAGRWALLSAACLVIAIVPEQYSEARLVSDFVSTPAGAAWSEQLGLYMWLTGTWANTGYTLMTVCWLLALRSLPGGPRGAWPTWAEASVVLAFSGASVANHLAWSTREGVENAAAFVVASAFNGLAFPGLLLLGAAMAIRIGDEQQQRIGVAQHAAAWPVAGTRTGRALAQLAGAPGLRDLVRSLQRWLFFPQLRSDVTDVMYLNWLVNADALQTQLPAGLHVQRFGDASLLTVLVYRHGNFGPAFLGPLRKLLPSPIQCNVRAYVREPPRHVSFINTSIDSRLYFLGARLLSDGLPAHLPASATLVRSGSALSAVVEPGAGSALSLSARVEEHDSPQLTAAFAKHFSSWQAAIDYLVPQNAAVRPLDTIGAWSDSSILVEVSANSARPANVIGRVEIGEQLAQLVSQAPLLAFVLPHACFSVRGETVRRYRLQGS